MRTRWAIGMAGLALVAAACRKEPAKKAEGAASDGATTVATFTGGVRQVPFVSGADPNAPALACRAAFKRPDWSGAGVSGLKIRTVHARGSREQVIRLAHEVICEAEGISKEKCTDDLFDPRFDGCDSDPRPARNLTPEDQALVDRIRAGVEGSPGGGTVQVPIGGDAATPPADAGAAPPAAPDGGADYLLL